MTDYTKAVSLVIRRTNRLSFLQTAANDISARLVNAFQAGDSDAVRTLTRQFNEYGVKIDRARTSLNRALAAMESK